MPEGAEAARGRGQEQPPDARYSDFENRILKLTELVESQAVAVATAHQQNKQFEKDLAARGAQIAELLARGGAASEVSAGEFHDDRTDDIKHSDTGGNAPEGAGGGARADVRADVRAHVDAAARVPAPDDDFGDANDSADVAPRSPSASASRRATPRPPLPPRRLMPLRRSTLRHWKSPRSGRSSQLYP